MDKILGMVDLYEIWPNTVSGGVLLFCLVWLLPEFREGLMELCSGFGEAATFTVFVAVAYVLGSLLQTPAHWAERLFWARYNGRPTDWILDPTRWAALGLDEKGGTKLWNEIREKFSDLPEDPAKTDRQRWHWIVRQITTRVESTMPVARLHKFEMLYLQYRGIYVGLPVAVGIWLIYNLPCLITSACWARPIAIGKILTMSLVILVAAIRLKKFAVNYAQELLLLFMLPKPKKEEEEKEK